MRLRHSRVGARVSAARAASGSHAFAEALPVSIANSDGGDVGMPGAAADAPAAGTPLPLPPPPLPDASMTSSVPARTATPAAPAGAPAKVVEGAAAASAANEDMHAVM